MGIRRRRLPRLRLALLLGLALGARSALAAPDADACPAWPGEPTPLPTVADADPVRARWALLRREELAARASRLEGPAPLRARWLRSRMRCLDPAAAETDADAAPLPGPTLHRPPVARGPAPEAAPDAWARLDAPVWPSAPVPGPRDAAPGPAERAAVPAERDRRRVAEAVDAYLTESEGLLRAARFERALVSAEAARSRLEALPDEAGASPRRVRLELATATAQVALGREREARAAFGRAIAADPALRLDPRRTSPKVLRVFNAARGAEAR